jgi:hypothetical protein
MALQLANHLVQQGIPTHKIRVSEAYRATAAFCANSTSAKSEQREVRLADRRVREKRAPRLCDLLYRTPRRERCVCVCVCV